MSATNVCEHGSLARSCEICAMQTEIAELRRQRDVLLEYAKAALRRERARSVTAGFDEKIAAIAHLETAEKDAFALLVEIEAPKPGAKVRGKNHV